MRWKRALVLAILALMSLCAAHGEPSSAPSTPGYSSSLWPFLSRPVAIPAVSHTPHLLDDALYASIATYRTLHFLSTRRVLAHGGREVELPQWVVARQSTFLGFEALAAAGEVGGSVWLIHHGHRRMARTMNVVSIGLGCEAVAHNYQQPLGAPMAPFGN